MEEVLTRTPVSPSSRCAADTDRDLIFTAEDALGYGIVDAVIISRKELAA